MLIVDPPAVAEWQQLRAAIRADATGRPARLAATATGIRRLALEMIDTAQLGHIGGDMSVTDILTTLYGGVLDVDAARPDWPERDRLVLSKGHCAAALYATLASVGFFPRAELRTFMAPLSPLNGHPNRQKVPGVETNTGPLGHGFPVAAGCAIAAKLQRASWRTVVVLGDGELQEGSNWEAAMTASHHGLDNLTAVVDRNRLQQGARTEETKRLDPLAPKFESFGWEVREVAGHDHAALYDALTAAPSGSPICVIAHTVKGKGISFMEDRVEWHHKVPDKNQVAVALEELAK